MGHARICSNYTSIAMTLSAAIEECFVNAFNLKRKRIGNGELGEETLRTHVERIL